MGGDGGDGWRSSVELGMRRASLALKLHRNLKGTTNTTPHVSILLSTFETNQYIVFITHKPEEVTEKAK